MTGMRYPLFLDLQGRRVLVVGGGAVGSRRSRALRDAGADVLVVDPSPSADLPDGVTVEVRAFTLDDLAGAWLVVVCTDDSAVTAAVAAAAHDAGIWCVRSDDATSSPAWVPAVTSTD